MSHRSVLRRILVAAAVLSLAACSDLPTPLGPTDDALEARGGFAPQDVAAWFAQATPEVLAIPGTVFADHDEAANVLVFGVENPGLARAVQNVLLRQGVPAEAYEIRVTEPIHFMSETLRTRHRPTVGGIQIHFPGFLCTLGFNVSHGTGGRSFITNSHCTSEQGSMTSTPYWQPTSSVDDTVIATEADDPAYFTGDPCSSGKRCRYSDAARAAYSSGVESSQGVIAKTTGENNGSITVAGAFTVATQNGTSTTFSGTIHKVGRTTGWTSGNVSNTCATVNVSGSDVQLLCQTLVQRRGRSIVGGGDSGSPVFRITSGDAVELVGILWGGSLNGDLFVFSPLKGVLDELKAFDATAASAPPTTGSISGTVSAQGGGGISGATVTVDGTSFSATTNGSGAYTISDVPAGTYSVTASAAGYVSQTQAGVSVTGDQNTTLNFTLAPVTSGGDMSVSDITITGNGGPNSDRHLRATVTVEAGGSPVSGALVQATLNRTNGGTGSWSFSGTTGSAGTVTFGLNNAPSGCYSLTVTSVTASGLTWDGSSPGNQFCKL
jgi:hypothetical protein